MAEGIEEKISYRVMKIHDSENAVFYRICCDCLDSDHDATLILEFDEEDPKILTLTMYQKVRWCDFYHYNDNWIGKIISRIKTCYRILLKGWIEFEGSMIFIEEEHVENFIQGLQEGKTKLKQKKPKG